MSPVSVSHPPNLRNLFLWQTTPLPLFFLDTDLQNSYWKGILQVTSPPFSAQFLSGVKLAPFIVLAVLIPSAQPQQQNPAFTVLWGDGTGKHYEEPVSCLPHALLGRVLFLIVSSVSRWFLLFRCQWGTGISLPKFFSLLSQTMNPKFKGKHKVSQPDYLYYYSNVYSKWWGESQNF